MMEYFWLSLSIAAGYLIGKVSYSIISGIIQALIEELEK
jgi:hypothetical protein